MSQALQNSLGRISRNRLLNPDGAIDQRNAGALVTTSGYTVDRYQIFTTVASKLSSQRYSTILGGNQPTNYSQSINVVAQYTPVSSDFMGRTQIIEGLRMRDLLWGTSNAKPMVYTIGVYTPTIGVYSISFRNGANTRSYVTTFTVNVANTLEFHTVVVPGDTTGTWPTDNTAHTIVTLSLGSGPTYTTSTLNQWQAGNFVKATGSIDFVASATSSVMYIAWEQYERDFATAPEILNFEDALSGCQRYYEVVNTGGYYTPSSTTTNTLIYLGYPFKITKRAAPTITMPSSANACWSNSGTNMTPSTWISQTINVDSFTVSATGTSIGGIQPNVYYASAEL